MGKTVQIDDDVMRAAERLAAERGTTPDAVISELARKGLTEPRSPPSADGVSRLGLVCKNGWYVLPSRGGPPVTSEMVKQLLEDADLEDAGIKRSE